MKTSGKLSALLLTLFTLSSLAFSQFCVAQEAPDAMVQRISLEVLNAAKTDKNIQAGNQKKVHELVEQKILPHVDFARMTSQAAGHDWNKGTPAQKAKLTAEFRTLLIYTYSGAISQIRDQKMVFLPMRSATPATDVEVHSEVKQSSGETIQLGYRLEKIGSEWKIYDMNIMGAWLVETYKGNFTTEISKGGFDGLIQTLTNKNKVLSQKNKS